jgi:hypothetical protein
MGPFTWQRFCTLSPPDELTHVNAMKWAFNNLPVMYLGRSGQNKWRRRQMKQARLH